MTLAVAKNYKMTYKSGIDDVINTSEMSDMSQKTPLELWGVYTLPFGVPWKPPSTNLKNKKKLTIDLTRDNFNNTCKNSFRILMNKVGIKKKSYREVYTPPIKPSPINK